MGKLKVGYDASVTLAPQGTGVARYTLELLRALVELAAPDVEFVVLLASWRHRRDERHAFLQGRGNVRVVERRVPGPLLLRGWQRAGVPTWEQLAGERCDVYHAPASYVAPAGARRVITVHDLGFLRDGSTEKLGGRYFREMFPRALPRADAIITPSRFVADDVAQTYAIPRERLYAVHHGLDQRHFRPRGERDAAILEELGVAHPSRRYLLGVTSPVARKRSEWLLAMREQGLPMLIVGLPPVKGDPAILGSVGDRELGCLYRNAAATVLTTREEGFGFPLIESLACGTSVICGRNSCLPEVGGPWPTYVEEETPDAFGAAAERMLAEPPSDEWRAQAAAFAAGYTWRAAAERTMAVYRGMVT